MKRGEENQVRQRERIHAVQSQCRASLRRLAALVPAAPWWFRIWVCLSPAKLQPSFFLNSQPTQAPSPKPPLLTHFNVCVSVSVWVSAFMFVFHSGFRAVFVFQYGFWCLCLCFGVDFKLGFQLCLHFGLGFWPLSAFRAGFLLVVLNLLFSIWVAYISARFFQFFCSFYFFGSSSLVFDGFWSQWWRCDCVVVSRLNSAAEPPRRCQDKGGETAKRSSAVALNGVDSLSLRWTWFSSPLSVGFWMFGFFYVCI